MTLSVLLNQVDIVTRGIHADVVPQAPQDCHRSDASRTVSGFARIEQCPQLKPARLIQHPHVEGAGHYADDLVGRPVERHGSSKNDRRTSKETLPEPIAETPSRWSSRVRLRQRAAHLRFDAERLKKLASDRKTHGCGSIAAGVDQVAAAKGGGKPIEGTRALLP